MNWPEMLGAAIGVPLGIWLARRISRGIDRFMDWIWPVPETKKAGRSREAARPCG